MKFQSLFSYIIDHKKIDVTLQTEASECGLACLVMAAKYYGYETDLNSLRLKLATSMKGITLPALIVAAGQIGLAARPVKTNIAGLSRLKCPVILHWNFNHYVILASIKRGRYEILDPGQGRVYLSQAEISEAYTGIALEISPGVDFEPKKEAANFRFGDLLGKLQGLNIIIFQIIIAAFAVETFNIASPLLIQAMVDNVLVPADDELILTIGIGFSLIIVLQVLANSLRAWLIVLAGNAINTQLASRLFRKLFKLPLSYFENRYGSDIALRFDSIGVVQRTVTTNFIEAIFDGVMSLFIVIVMFFYSSLLAFVAIAAVCIYLFVKIWIQPYLYASAEEDVIRSGRQRSLLLESVRGAQSIKMFNRRYHREVVWRNQFIEALQASAKHQVGTMFSQSANKLIFGLENVLAVCIGARLVLNGTISTGMLLAFLAYKAQFSIRVSALIDKALEVRTLKLHKERLADIVLASEEPGLEGIVRKDEIDANFRLELRDIGFRHSATESWLFRHVNLIINAGESIAITGPSGVGKTTLLKIIAGLIEPVEGQVLMNEIPVKLLGLEAYRQNFGAVMQEDQLFAGSVAENIAFFEFHQDMERIIESAKLANIHDEIEKMPMRYHSLITDKSAAMSGGQKQRVLLARAIYIKPNCLLLDEATSHLDVENEKKVNDNIKSVDYAKIIIAHRMETIKSADRIYSLNRAGLHELELQEAVTV